ncbi:MAG: glycosyltransferase family 4 protein, partial [Phycisphaeraceae bacterium]|nr:glycosyltransferase family 4 protein [Phycisphaeraceae bacterium]
NSMTDALVITETFPPRVGGSGRWLYELYRRMPDYSSYVLAGEIPGETGPTDLPVERMELTFPSWGVLDPRSGGPYWRALRVVLRRWRQLGRPAIHAGRCLPEGLLTWTVHSLYRSPYVCYVHGEELNTMASSRELSFLARRVFGSAQCIIANSRHTAGLLQRDWLVKNDRLHVLHPGVDAERFRPTAADSAWRKSVGWGDRPVLLTVGRLQTRKGHDRMIEALAELAKRGDTATCYAIAGDGPERSRLESMARELGLRNRVLFMGRLGEDELLRCYQQCDVFVLPNRTVAGDFEGFGMVLLEAQACGKPVIAGITGGTGEAMQADQTGLLVDADNVPVLADAVQGLMRDPARRLKMGYQGRVWARERFDWDVLSAQARAIFAESSPKSAGGVSPCHASGSRPLAADAVG